MYVVREEKNIEGLPFPNKTRLIITQNQPDVQLITSVFVLAFKKDKLLLTNLRKRGWDIPGGHIELGETPDIAAHRELLEETGAKVGKLDFLGYEEISLLGNKPEGYKYPYPNSYMIFYCAEIVSIEEYKENEESSGSEMFSPEQARKINWVKENLELYDEALRIISK